MNALKPIAAVAALSAVIGAILPHAAMGQGTQHRQDSPDAWASSSGRFSGMAWVDAADGMTRLLIGCSVSNRDNAANVPHIYILTEEDYTETASEAGPMPVLVRVGNVERSLVGEFRSASDKLSVSISEDVAEFDPGLVRAAFTLMRAGFGRPIEIMFLDTPLSFPSKDAQERIGEMLDACW